MSASICLSLRAGLESLASAFISPVVAYLSQDVFGYVGTTRPVSEMSTVERQANAAALSSALLYTMILPWLPCFVVYSMMHWTYRHDRDAYLASVRSGERQGLLEKP